jgi:germination protein M
VRNTLRTARGRRRPIRWWAWLLVSLGVLAAACSSTTATTTAPPTSTSPPTTATTTATTVATTTTTTTLPPRLFEQVAYFFTGDPPRLVPYVVMVPGTAPQLALDALSLDPPTAEGLPVGKTALTPGTAPEILGIENGVASVSLPDEFAEGPVDQVRRRLAQVVYTLTRLYKVSAVELLVEGVVVNEVGGVALRVPTPRSPDFDDLAGPLLIDSPALGQSVSSPVQVHIATPARDAPLRISIADWSGITTGISEAPAVFIAESDVEYCTDEPGPGTLRVDMGEVTVTQPVVLAATPDRDRCVGLPLAASGWSLEPGDLLAQSPGEVNIIRDGLVVATPVASPASGLLPLDPETLVVVPAGSPDLWIIRADGTTERLYRGNFGVHLLGLVTVAAFGPGEWLAFSEMGPNLYGPAAIELEMSTDWLVLLNLETHVRLVMPAEVGEGDYNGIASGGAYVVMSASAEGDSWIEARNAVGEEVALPHNPAPHDAETYPRGLHGLTGIPGTRLWAFTTSDDYAGAVEEYLVIYDPASGTEMTRSAVPGSAEERVMVWQVDADTATVAVTTAAFDSGAERYEFVAHLFDLATGTWTSFEVPGLVRLVG